MDKPLTIAVLGAGAWGLALANHLSLLGHTLHVWDRSPEVIQQLQSTRSIDRPKGLVMPAGVTYHDSLPDAMATAEMVLSVVPSYATLAICKALAVADGSGMSRLFVNCSKGIDPDTFELPHEAFRSVFGDNRLYRYSVLAGPSHAEEVCRQVPTAVVAAAYARDDAEMLQQAFSSPKFRVYLQDDVAGVELGGALKNVLAIAAGVCDGRGFGDNTKAAIITRGVAEMSRLAVAIGAHQETVAGLSGLGDLIVTAMSRHSRNRGFGELLAQGRTPEQALAEIGAVVEGYKTARSAHQLALRYQVDLPLVETIYKVLYEGLEIGTAIEQLLGRSPHEERLG